MLLLLLLAWLLLLLFLFLFLFLLMALLPLSLFVFFVDVVILIVVVVAAVIVFDVVVLWLSVSGCRLLLFYSGFCFSLSVQSMLLSHLLCYHKYNEYFSSNMTSYHLPGGTTEVPLRRHEEGVESG